MPSTQALIDWGEMRAEKFGRVMFSGTGTNNIGCDRDHLSSSSSIRLSNLDLKWYTTGVREIHPAYSANAEKSVSLTCPLSVEDQFGVMVTREMTFLLPELLGRLVGPNLELVRSGNAKLVEQAQRAGHSNEEIDRTIKSLEGGSLAAFCGVGKNSDPDILLHVSWALVFVWDDFVDNPGGKEEFKQYEQLAQIIDYMIDVLRGNKLSLEGMSPEVAAAVKKHEGFFHLLRKDAFAASERYGNGTSPMPALDAIAEYLPSVLLENCTEWNALRGADLQMYEEVQRANREITAGVYPTVECFALVDGIHVEDSIRRSFLFKQFRSMVARHVTLVNDLFSYAKEYANGEVSNVIYLHHVEGGCSMEESLARLEEETNQVSKAMAELGELLLRLYRNDEGLERFVRHGKAVAYGHLQWYSYSRRYYPDLVFDMIVH